MARLADRYGEYFRDRVVLVTGGSSGIGEALAYQLGAAGAKVVITARRGEELERVASKIASAGGTASHIAADLTELSECDRVMEFVLEEHHTIDVLINNAGRSIRRPVKDSLERFHDLERLMQLNYFAPARLMRGALPYMLEQGSGNIVNILSAGAGFPSPGYGAYTATKAALAQLGDTLACEITHKNIHVTSAFLSFVRTPMVKGMDHVKMKSPEEAAGEVLEGVAKEKNHLTTSLYRAGNSMSIFAPGLLNRITNRVFRMENKRRRSRSPKS